MESSLDRTLVLENGQINDIPKEVIRYLERNNILWDWKNVNKAFWPDNREATFEYFSNLPEGKQLMCSTVFDGLQQLELFIDLFYKLEDKKFTFRIMYNGLPEELLSWYKQRESSITPKELDDNVERAWDISDAAYKAAYQMVYDFKNEKNERFLKVLEAHNIIWVRRFGDEEVLFKHIGDIESAAN